MFINFLDISDLVFYSIGRQVFGYQFTIWKVSIDDVLTPQKKGKFSDTKVKVFMDRPVRPTIL